MEQIIVACISGVLALIGVLISNRTNADRMQKQLELNQAVTETKLESLTAEVQKHNNFASRLPALEEQLKSINHRIDVLERRSEQ